MTIRLQATEHARRAIRDQLDRGSSLRISFAGGCGAFGYRIGAARRAYPGDQVVSLEHGVEVLLDQRAATELDDAIIGFDTEEGFFIDHPQSGRSC